MAAWRGSAFLRANATLLASHQASDIVGVAPEEKRGEYEEQQRHLRLAEKQEEEGNDRARSERRERGVVVPSDVFWFDPEGNVVLQAWVSFPSEPTPEQLRVELTWKELEDLRTRFEADVLSPNGRPTATRKTT